MTKKTKMWLAAGAVAALVTAGGVYYYEKKKGLPSGTTGLLPAATFQSGKRYHFAAPIARGINDTTALEEALKAQGWSDIHIDYFAGTGDASPFPVGGPNAYVATATYNGGDVQVPAGVTAVVA